MTPTHMDPAGFTAYTADLVDALTRPLTDEEKEPGMYVPDKHEGALMTGTYDEVQRTFEGELWSSEEGDGPPGGRRSRASTASRSARPTEG